MSDNSGDESPQEIEEAHMPTVLEELKGDNPKIFGIDYYHVIYAATGCLALGMAFLYTVLEDKEVQRMVLIQGFFSIGLLLASMYFRQRLHARKVERAEEKQKLE
jgi:hypothetical protein